MRILPLIILLLLPSQLLAWNGSDHQLMVLKALEEVQGLEEPCDIRPLQSFLDKLASQRESLKKHPSFLNYLKINPRTDLEKELLPLAGKRHATPREILATYPVDPDDGRDQDLPETSPDQRWFGVAVGPDSQAFRHIEKPPLSLRHPVATFGFPFRSIGEATQRVEIYFVLSEIAFSLSEDYWGWRFLAGALHYLEDLYQPFHAGQITPGLLIRGLQAYLSWGYKEKDPIQTIAHVVSNLHRFFESTIALPMGPDPPLKQEILASLKGTGLSPAQSVRELALQARDRSNLFFPSLTDAVSRVVDPILFSPYDFKSDEEEGADNPARFVRHDPEARRALGTLFEITQDRFSEAGTAIRTIVSMAVAERGRQTPEDLLKTLDKLLKKSP